MKKQLLKGDATYHRCNKFRDMKDSIEKLKKELLQHPKVVHSILMDPSNWKRNHYIFLSNLIEEELKKSPLMTQSRIYELGNSISESTIKRFFSSSHDTKYSTDLRFIKTLDKFCIFLGYYDLNDFLQKNLQPQDDTNTTIPPETLKATEVNIDFFQNLIHDYCNSEFESITKLPEVDLCFLDKFVFKNSPFQKRISRYLQELQENGYSYNLDHNNHSNYEIFDLKTKLIESNFVVISTKEFWNLSLKNKQGIPVTICNFRNKQEYYIKNINCEWKIWDNFNPHNNNLIENIKKFSKSKF